MEANDAVNITSYNNMLISVFGGGSINTIGSINPYNTNTYSLGTSSQRWVDAYIGPSSLHFGTTTEDIASISAVGGPGGTGLSITGDLIPSATETYNLGTSTQRWNSIFVGPATINIAGPIGSGKVGTIGTDSDGIVFTEGGFATPFLTVGPEILVGATLAGAIGGWQLSALGSATGPDYDLVAQQNGVVIGSGLTGPVYSLVQSQKTNISSITAGAGISVIGSGTTSVTVSLEATGPGITTIGYPASVTLNEYGQVTSITGGTGSVGTLTGLTATSAHDSQLVFYNTTNHALSYATNAYSCVVVTAPITVALDPTFRGRTYIVTNATTTITFTHADLSSNDVGFFIIVKNGNANTAGNQDITIVGPTGNTTVHEPTGSQNGGVIHVYWNGTALIAY
jgi:hypothetical protein